MQDYAEQMEAEAQLFQMDEELSDTPMEQSASDATESQCPAKKRKESPSTLQEKQDEIEERLRAPTKRQKGFRLCAKQVFLTWPQCPLEKEHALEQLMEKAAIKDYVVAQEKHEVSNSAKTLECGTTPPLASIPEGDAFWGPNYWENQLAQRECYVTESHKFADALEKDLLDDNWMFY